MKNIRLFVLSALIIIALAITVVPAFAETNLLGPAINWSFEYDTDGNGVPNNWHMAGENILHVCGHNNPRTYDDCVIAFLSNKDGRAVIWQYYDIGPLADLEEGWKTEIINMYAAASKLPSGRLYGGWVACWEEFDYCVRYYGAVPGGSYNFSNVTVYGGTEFAEVFGVYLFLLNYAPSDFAWGFMALPGDGQAFIDLAQPTFYIP